MELTDSILEGKSFKIEKIYLDNNTSLDLNSNIHCGNKNRKNSIDCEQDRFVTSIEYMIDDPEIQECKDELQKEMNFIQKVQFDRPKFFKLNFNIEKFDNALLKEALDHFQKRSETNSIIENSVSLKNELSCNNSKIYNNDENNLILFPTIHSTVDTDIVIEDSPLKTKSNTLNTENDFSTNKENKKQFANLIHKSIKENKSYKLEIQNKSNSKDFNFYSSNFNTIDYSKSTKEFERSSKKPLSKNTQTNCCFYKNIKKLTSQLSQMEKRIIESISNKMNSSFEDLRKEIVMLQNKISFYKKESDSLFLKNLNSIDEKPEIDQDDQIKPKIYQTTKVNSSIINQNFKTMNKSSLKKTKRSIPLLKLKENSIKTLNVKICPIVKNYKPQICKTTKFDKKSLFGSKNI